jgi:hypothetical protein
MENISLTPTERLYAELIILIDSYRALHGLKKDFRVERDAIAYPGFCKKIRLGDPALNVKKLKQLEEFLIKAPAPGENHDQFVRDWAERHGFKTPEGAGGADAA